jgi:circadian clock protein KaiB
MNDPTTHSVQAFPWNFRLYIAGQSPNSLAATSNLYALCDTYLRDKHQIEIIDLREFPQQAELDKIVAIPTLIRVSPEPIRRLIGDLSNTQKVLITLGIAHAGMRPDGSQI